MCLLSNGRVGVNFQFEIVRSEIPGEEELFAASPRTSSISLLRGKCTKRTVPIAYCSKHFNRTHLFVSNKSQNNKLSVQFLQSQSCKVSYIPITVALQLLHFGDRLCLHSLWHHIRKIRENAAADESDVRDGILHDHSAQSIRSAPSTGQCRSVPHAHPRGQNESPPDRRT